MSKRGRKPRKPFKGNGKGLALPVGTGKYSPEEVKALWDEYRMGKFYACMGDMLDMAAAYSLKGKGDYEYQENRRHPAQGSAYYVFQIEAPLWFYEEELR